MQLYPKNTDQLSLTADISVNGNGVFATDVLSGLILAYNEFEGNEGAHVLLHGSNATLLGNSYVSNGVLDFKQQKCGVTGSPVDISADGLTESHIVEICEGYDDLTVPQYDFCLTLTEVEPQQ